MTYKESFIKFMVDSGVLKFGEFTLKSGRLAPYFINAGNYKTGAQLAKLGEFYAECIMENGLKPQTLFGPAYKGIPLSVSACTALYNKHGVDVNYCFDRKEVKDIHSYMSIVANPRDDVRLRRIINEPARKIGATTIEVIADLAAQQGISMLDVISHADQYAKLSRAIASLFKFWDIYQKLQESLETKTLDEFASDVIEITGYRAMLEADAAKGHEDAADRLQNLGQLVNNVKSYCDQHGEEASLEGYLEDIALISLSLIHI